MPHDELFDCLLALRKVHKGDYSWEIALGKIEQLLIESGSKYDSYMIEIADEIRNEHHKQCQKAYSIVVEAGEEYQNDLYALIREVNKECDGLETWCAAMQLEHNFPGDTLDPKELGGVMVSVNNLRKAVLYGNKS